MSHVIFTRRRPLLCSPSPLYTTLSVCLSVSLPITPYGPHILTTAVTAQTHTLLLPQNLGSIISRLRFRPARITINENICQKKQIRIRCKNSVVSSYVSSTYCRRLLSRYLKSHTKQPLPAPLPAQETIR